MGFGLLKHFKESKIGNVNSATARHYEHLIIGQDLGAILKLVELRRSIPHESIKLLTPRLLSRQLLLENYDYGVAQIRSLNAVENIYKKYHHARIHPHSKGAAFYKDGKFHEFSGRAKGMELKKGEEFFTQKGHRLELSGLFSSEDWNNLDAILKEHCEIKIFEAIEKVSPNDLVDKKEWFLSFRDFSQASCEHLYVSLSPKKFLSLMNHKEKLTPEFIDVCSSTQVQGAISVTWMLDKEIFPEERTLFIPQSMTHEWGHFLVEFESYDYQKKQQICHILFLIHDEGPQSEELATKIKLMKRVLDRVFSDIDKHIVKEYIRFDEEMFISEVKDTTLETLSFDYPTLHFLGQTAPMTGELHIEKFLARTILN